MKFYNNLLLLTCSLFVIGCGTSKRTSQTSEPINQVNKRELMIIG